MATAPTPTPPLAAGDPAPSHEIARPRPSSGQGPAAGTTGTTGAAGGPAPWSRVAPIVLLVVLVALTVGGYATLIVALPPHVGLTLLLFVLFGGGGGVLFAVRENELRSPGFVNGGIQLGWIADGMFGVAGAVVIVLLIPGLSENAPELVKRLHQERRGEGAAPDAPKGAGTDLLELAAIALIGGFGGRSVLKQASDQVLKKVSDMEKAQQAMSDEAADLRRDLDSARQEADRFKSELETAKANSAALELVARQINPEVKSPPVEELRTVLGRATRDGRLRVFDYTVHRYRTEPTRVADAVLPVLRVLLELDPDALGSPVRKAIEEVTDSLRPSDTEAVAAARQVFDAGPLPPAPPPKPAPAASSRTSKR